jgi:hypothetical protein
MAYDIRNLSFSLIASSSMQSRQYQGVRASTVEDYFIIGATTTAITPIGILQNNPVTGDAGEIWIPGCISKIACRSALNPGSNFWIANNGLAYSTAAIPLKASMYGPVLIASASSGIATVSFSAVGMTT